MGKGGDFDFGEIEKLKKRIERLGADRDDFIRKCMKELAQKLLQKVKQRTPVETGKLRRNWIVGETHKNGENYEVEIINPTEYSSYVEYGHRTVKGWVPGKFMLTISEKEIEAMAPKLIEKKLEARLREVFDA